MTFKIGMPVVQISPWRETDTAYPDVRFTSCGVVYTIREFALIGGSLTGLRFCELVNPIKRYRGLGAIEQAFPIWNFRPAVSPGISFDETIRSPLDSEQWDNRKRVDEPAWGASA